MAFKTNVVKTNWEVRARQKEGFRTKVFLVLAESEETAKQQVPEEYEAVDVRRIDGKDGGQDE